MAQIEVQVITDNTNLLPHIRREVLNCGGRIVGEHSRAKEALPAIRENPEAIVLLDLPANGQIQDLSEIAIKVPRAQIVVLGHERDVDRILEYQRKGAAQVVLAPINAEDFAEAVHRIIYQQQHMLGRGVAVSVTGVTHGVGATLVACNLASEIGDYLGQNVFLVDFNINIGEVSTYLDLSPQYTLGDLFEYAGQLDRQIVQTAITAVGPYLRVLCAPRNWLGKETIDLGRAEELITILQGMEHLTVIDAPCTYDDVHFGTLLRSDFCVLMAEQDVPSIRALGQIIAKLYAEGVTADQIIVVINRFNAGDQKVPREDIEPVIQHPINHQIGNDYQAARRAIDHGQLLKVANPDSRLRRDIVRLAELVCSATGYSQAVPRFTPLDPPSPGTLTRLARTLGLTRA